MRILSLDDPAAIPAAVEVFQRGEVMVIPTDTVYGVGCSPFNEAAIDQLFEAKQRPREKAIQVLLADVDGIELFAERMTPLARRLAERFWPGALTLTLPKRGGLPPNISLHDTIGLRIPNHEGCRALIRALGGAIAITSANLSGGESPTSIQMAMDSLGEAVALYIDGGTMPGSLSSTVVESHGDTLKVLRVGPISEDMLRAALVE